MDTNPTDLPKIKGQSVKINLSHLPQPLVELLSGRMLVPTLRDLHGWLGFASLPLHDPTLVVQVCKALSTHIPYLLLFTPETCVWKVFWAQLLKILVWVTIWSQTLLQNFVESIPSYPNNISI